MAKWIAGYYVTPIGMVLGTMVPAAVKRATGARTTQLLRPATAFDASALPARRRKVWDALTALPANSFPADTQGLAALLGFKTTAPVKQLIEAGALDVQSADVIRAGAMAGLETGAAHTPAATADLPTLTDEQRTVVDAIAVPVTGAEFGVHVLEGVTGSGKTEVYLRLIQRVLDAGRTAIVLVPEIALTPQTSGRFMKRFGHGVVAVLHSGLTASQRHAEWSRCQNGLARVVVGARSCVFAPLTNVGLIVVDEEHDSSYKQDQLPRYHGRDVAVKRAQLEGCPCVLGSATPSLESWSNTRPSLTGAPPRFRLHRLTHRVGGATLPQVRIVDLAEERRIRAQLPGGIADAMRQHLLGPTLERAMEHTLRAGGQVMLLLNRRGFAHHIACPDTKCGYVLMCDSCDSCLVQHKSGVVAGGLVRCHHCLTEQRVPKLCPTCGKNLGSLGMGTQRLEDEVARKFASDGIVLNETMLRLDSDTMQHARDYYNALARFASGEVRVLLGTQMISKGLDFPNVRLVGVVDADTALSLPDFRAEERTFQLVSQVAGRAGRGVDAGLTIVQTRSPQNAAILLAADHDFTAFATRELAIRQRAGLPPATRMARIVCRDKDAAKARSQAESLAHALAHAAEGTSVHVTSPEECAISRISDHWRWEVRVIADGPGSLRNVLTTVRRQGMLKSDSRTAVDVDPVALL